MVFFIVSVVNACVAAWVMRSLWREHRRFKRIEIEYERQSLMEMWEGDHD